MILTANIGENLRLLRDKQGITQEQLAGALNVSADTIWKWEHNTNKIKADTVVEICNYFNISCDLFLRGGKAENLVLINETGLSDTTIQRLKENNSNERLTIKYMPVMFNILANYPMVLLAIWNYLSDDFPEIETPEQVFFSEDTERLSRLHILDAISDMRKEFWGGASNEAGKR